MNKTMNKKIEEFAEQCYEKHELLGTYEFNKEKFAKLIVRECLGIMQNCDGDLNFAIWKTKKDFGVE